MLNDKDTTATASRTSPDQYDPRRSNRRVAIASLVGTLVEGYDFVMFALAAALVFPHVFFPALSESAGTVASLATLGVAFVARPVGAMVCGHFGDRVGRKKTLVVTLLIMGVSSAMMGLVPSAERIGVAAPIIIVVLRIFQGFAVGGEWAGSTSFVAEHAPAGKRGFYAMFPQLGHALPQAVSSAIFLTLASTMSDEAFMSWGWRIPFLFSLVLVGIGLYIRLKIDETPVFKNEMAKGRVGQRAPLVESFRTQPREIFKAMGVPLTMFGLFYVATSYLAGYGANVLDFSRTEVLTTSLLAGVCYAIATPLSAIASDRIGRRRMLSSAQIAGVFWALALFPMINTGHLWLYMLGICITTSIAGCAYGPLGAFLPEQFHTRFRYTAVGVSYNVSGIIGGGLVPLLAPILAASAGTLVFGLLLASLCAISAACTLSLREVRHGTLDNV